MKRWIALLLAILLLGLAACAKPEPKPAPENPPAAETPKEEQPKEEDPKQEQPEEEQPAQKPAVTYSIGGTYRAPEPDSEGIETVVEVHNFGTVLVMEYFHLYEGSTFSFWTEEFWLDEDCVIGRDKVLTGTSQEFSIMSKGNEYFGMPRNRTVTVTEDGLVMQYEGFDEEIYIPDDSGFAGHTPNEELKDILYGTFDLKEKLPEGVAGSWSCYDGWWDCWVDLREDGTVTVISKEPGKPIHLLNGAWGMDRETQQLRLMCEIAGEGTYPHMMTWELLDSDDAQLLILKEEYQLLMPEVVDGVWFWEAEPTYTTYMTQAQAVGYVCSYYDLSGSYTDGDGTNYYYVYDIPLLLEAEGDAAEINAEILAIYEPIVEDALAAMGENGYLDTEMVYWEQYLTEDILTIHVYSYSFNWETHHTWYYDLRTNRRTDSGELLKRLDISADDLLNAVRVMAEQHFIDTYAGMPVEDRKQYGYYEMLDWTVSDEAVNLQLPIFVDRMGDLIVYARVGSLAGPMETWVLLCPFAEWDGAVG